MTLLAAACAFALSGWNGVAQTVNDFRTVGSGNWTNTAVWEQFNGLVWAPPASAPTSANGIITIRNGHSVTNNSNLTLDQVTVAAGGQLTVNSGVTVTLADGTGTDLDVSGTLQVNGNGLITGGAGTSVQLESGATLKIGSLNGISASGSTGNIQTAIRGFSTSANYVYLGSAGQETGSGLPATVNDLTIANSADVSLSASVTVNGVLTFTAGKILAGGSQINMGNSATVSGAGSGSYVVGTVEKSFPVGNNQSFTFPIGDEAAYAPARLSKFNVVTSGSVLANTTAGEHGSIAGSGINAARDVNRFWTLTGAGIDATNFTATFNFVAGDLDVGTVPGVFVVGRYDGSWSAPELGTRTTTNIQVMGLNDFGDFAVGELTSKLVFVQQPTAVIANAAIAPAVTVQLQDNSSSNVLAAGVEIIVSLNSGSGALSGTLTNLTDANGLATFNNLSVNLIGPKTLIATHPDLTSAVSASFTVASAATPPGIATQPASVTTTMTSNVVLSVVATGTPPFSYQWIFDGTNILSDGEFFSGANSNTLTITNARRAHAGVYSVVITNEAGSITSGNASLTVNLPPGVLFFDDFIRIANPGSVTPWAVESGEWATTDSVLQGGTNNLSSYGFIHLNKAWTDYSVQAQIQFGPDAYGGGIGARVDPTTGSHYAAWIYPENSPGGSNVLRLINFSDWLTFTVLAETNIAAVGTDLHLLKLSVVGEQIAVEFDGFPVLSAQDASYPSGSIALGMWTADTEYAMNIDNVLVVPANTPPELPLISDQVVTEFNTLSITNTANDNDIPANTISYQLLDAPANASIGANGVITFVPNEAQGSTTNVITTRAMDNGSPPLSVTNSFTVIVLEGNTAPVLPVIGQQTIAEGSLLSVNDGATDSDVPVNTLTYSLVNPPAGASINSSGLITWTPSETQGPSTNTIKAVVNDGTVSVTNTIVVVVTEVNVAPVLPTIGQQTVAEGSLLSVNDAATDSDLPPNTLTYSLISPPSGASINGSGLITWTPSEAQGPSTNTITAVVNDGTVSVTNSFTVIVTEVNSAPVLPTISQQTVAEGSPLSVNYAATDNDIPANALTYLLVNPPSGMNINGSGLVTWTPTEAQGPGTNTIIAVVNDGTVSVTNSFTVRVTEVNSAPVLPTISQQTVAEGSLLSVNDAATDSDIPANTLTYSLVNPPSGVSINGSGLITWTPTEAQGPSTNTITGVVNDGTVSVTNSFVVVVTEVNTLPVLPSISQQTVAEGSLLSVSDAATDSDLPANTLTYSLISPPSGTSINGSGLITWTPSEAQGPSTNTITAVVNDGTVNVTNSFVVVVTEVNSAPIFPTLGQQTVAEGSLLSVNDAATDNDIPANTLTYSLVTPPSGVSINSSGLITWTPTEVQGPSTNTIKAVVNDGTVSVTNSLVVVVTEVNVAPVLPSISQQTVAEGSLLSVSDAATDSDVPANTLTYSLVNPPAGASINSSGLITWTPTEAQGPSTNTISAVVNDGAVNVTNSFVVVVTEVNVAPILPTITQQTVAEGSLLSVNDAATDTDLPANTLTYSLISPPAGASVNSSGLITWTPSEAQGPGTNTITAVVNDGTVSVTNSFVVVVTEVNSAPVLPTISQQTVAEGSLLSVNDAATDSDIPANTLSYSLVNPPAGASINSSGLITWTPTEAQGPSTNTIMAVVNDDTVNVTNSFVVVVTEVNVPPVLPTVSQQTVAEGTLLSVNDAATDSDIPANTLTYSLVNPPAGVSINSSGLITWTPTEVQGPGTNTITAVVNDGTVSVTNSFVVIVTEVNSAPVLPTISQQTVAEGSLLSVNDAATDGDVPANTLTYSLVNPASGVSINGSGLITWTPTEAQGPSTNTITAVVNDGTVSVTNSFIVRVTEVNVAPVLPTISQQTVAEGSLLSVSDAATDSDLPANTLAYSLVNPPAGASINGSGLVTWTPSEAQGPSTNTITAVVNDGTVSVTNSFVVVVTEVNVAPILPTISQQTVGEGTLLSVNDAATDSDVPANTLTYSLINPPAGASINSSGLITWTPTETQGPGTNTITAVVNDGTVSVTNSFVVVVTEANAAPVLPTISQQTVAEGSLLSVSDAATDSDIPANTLTYSLVNPPAGASINSSGLITWTPSEAQGPTTNTITAVVNDGTVNVTNAFVVVVTEVNVAPILPTITQQTVVEGSLLSVNDAATDTDLPANTLSYSLINPPAGASINTSGLITWTPTEVQGPSTNTITAVVNDGSASVTNSFVVVVTEVNTAPVLPTISQQTVAEGSLLSVNDAATDSDIPANTLTYSLVNPPAGASINISGLITWTPTEAQGPSTNTITVVVNDGTVNVTNSFVVIVSEVNVAPVPPTISQQIVAEGTLLSVNDAATDSDIPANTLTYSLINPPAGASINGSGLITWTPTEVQGPGTNTITAVVNDGTVSVTNSFVVIVTEVNSAPVLPTITQQTVAEGSLLSVNDAATDTDVPANTLTYSLVNPPSGVSINGSGLITWTPTEAQGPSTNTITAVVNDGTVSVTNSFVVVVTEVNTAPLLPTINQQTVAEGSLLSVNDAATDSDLPANTLTYAMVNPPAGANINSSGQITWTPSEAQGPSTNTITAVVNDGTVSVTNSFVVVVTEVNVSPVLPTISQQTVGEGTLLSVNDAATDSDVPANTLTYSLINPPAGASINGSGLITWTPTETQGPGTNTITALVNDGMVSVTNSFVVVVTEVNVAPVLPTISQQTVAEGSLLSVSDAATDSDIPANALTYSLVNPPLGMSINGSGLITWTPTEAQGPSTNTITTVVNDGTVSVTNAFVVVVTEVNVAPILPIITQQTIAEGSLLSVTNAATDSDIPANTLTYSLINSPSGASINSSGLITWTPNEAQGPSTNTITAVVSDGTASVTNSFVVVVTEVNSAPVLPTISQQTVAEGSLLSVNDAALDLDIPANTLTYSLISPPAGASINSSGLITWTPTEAQGPSTNAIIAAVDDGTVSVLNVFIVVVTEVNSAPVLPTITQQTVAEGSLLSVNDAATDSDIPANTLSYSLVNPPAGMTISGSGLITWTPTEAQGPSTNTITAVVNDGKVSVTNSFVVVVSEINSAPVLPTIGQQAIAEGSLLSINDAATDSDVPANTLAYSLINPPSGASINSSGLITWTPTEAQGPSTNTIIAVVNDGTVSVTNSFVVVVTEVNSTPLLPVIGQRTVAEGSLLSVTNTATDTDIPTNTLSYTLVNPPSGMSVNGSGLITWTPTEAQGPGTNTIVTVVNDGAVSVTNSFVVIVTEVNNPPVLPVQTDRTIEVLTTLTVTNTATDSDLPANTLSYLLINPPAGASISSQGIITWTPTVGQGNTTNIITTVVNDGTASVTNSFHVFVNAVVVPNITGFSVNSGIATITWNSASGRNYRLQYKNDLSAASWTDVTPDVPATGSSTTTTDSIAGSPKRWYRVMLVP